MADFFSTHWYRVAKLRPQLNPGVQVARHRYRGQPWYVLHDPATARTHRLSPQAYGLVGRMDGRQTLDEIWRAALPGLGEDAPTQDELLQLIGQLHSADILRCDVAPDAAELFERQDRTLRARRWAGVRNPLAIRIPLWDPDRFLERSLPFVRPLMGWGGLLLWVLLVAPALVLAGVHWDALAGNLSDRVLAMHNLVLLWLTFPIVKLLHELGHAWAAKAGGAEVHEIGLMLLVFAPVPYVDSSRTSRFRSKWGRAGVGAAGMLVETALASLALFAWVLLEPGLARAVCFNVMLIAGVSTLVFNLNPLLKFDGYYILCDLIEMPNLAQRSQRFVAEAVDHHLFRAPARPAPALQPGERGWLALYAPVSAVYRLVVMFTIAIFVASEYFVVGVLLALLAIGQGLVLPLAKGLRHLAAGDSLHARRGTAQLTAAALAAVLALGLFVLPAPDRSVVQGVVWLPDDAQIRARASGFVQAVLRQPGAAVREGEGVLLAAEPVLEAQLQAQQARVEELQARLDAERFDERARAELTRQALAAEEAVRDRLLDEIARQQLGAGRAGRLVLPRAGDLPGRYLRQGDLVGHVDVGARRELRIVVPQEDIDAMRQRLRRVTVRLANDPAVVLPAALAREVPAGQDQLPSRALASDAGGPFGLDPADPEGRRTLNRVFQFDLALAEPTEAPVGTRVFARLEFEPLPLGWQLWRALRRLFLSRFDV